MSTQGNQNIWYFLIGAGFLGFWLGMGMFDLADQGWFIWGLFGIAIAAAFYVGRLTNETVRYAIWILIGLSLGILLVAAFVEGEPMFIATFVTGSGAGLIAAGLPSPYQQDGPQTPSPHGLPSQRPLTGAPPQHQPPVPPASRYGQQQQWGPGQQQQQQGQRIYGEEYR